MTRVKHGMENPLYRAAVNYHNQQGVQYSNRDSFTTDRAAGAVDGTNSEPGPGVREIVDTAGTRVVITGGAIATTGNGAWAQAGWYLTPAIVREAGRVLKMQFSMAAGVGNFLSGFAKAAGANVSDYDNTGIANSNVGFHQARHTTGVTSPIIVVSGVTSGIFYTVLRANGRFILYDPNNGSDVQLLWWDEWDSTSSLYIGASALNNTGTISVQEVLAPDNRFFNISPYVKAADTFNRSDGAIGSTDGAVLAEGGGSGVAWSSIAGTWAVASNKAQASALASSIAIAAIDSGSRDALIECDLVRSAGNVGIVARYTDANNYLRAYHDGTNAVLQQVLAGTPSTLITAAATYSANAPIRVHLDGTRALLYYNDLYIGTSNTANAALTGTRHGLYTTDTGNTQDNFVCLDRYGYNAIRLAA